MSSTSTVVDMYHTQQHYGTVLFLDTVSSLFPAEDSDSYDTVGLAAFTTGEVNKK